MRTMTLAKKGGAGRAEAHLAAKREQPAVGFVLIDERLEGSVDDLDLASHPGQAPRPCDEIVPEIDHRPYHDICLADSDIMVNGG